jgi:hypothetical protein
VVRFWTVGALYFYNAVFHIFFGQLAAHYIGWEDNPFQLEVGMASLGFAVVGFLAALSLASSCSAPPPATSTR